MSIGLAVLLEALRPSGGAMLKGHRWGCGC
jgi:hypothetical protein